MSRKLNVTPGMLLAFMAVFILGTASAATAGSLINGKKIKKGSIPYSALSKDAKKKLAGKAGPQGPAGAPGAAGAAAARSWAFIKEDGSLGRSSGGVSSSYVTNGGTNKQYQVKFPGDISQCAYQVTTGDTDPIGNAFAVDGAVAGVTRSSSDASTIAITLWARNTPQQTFVVGNMVQSAFYVTLFC